MGRILVAVVVAGVLVGGGFLVWEGANSPTARWFGSQISHGPRNQRGVALTFDDGPNGGTTLAVADLLDARGVKGTFFSVGKAVEARPDISAALVARGHLLGNHSYHHDSTSWLDPRYPELMRTQRTFRRRLARCPAFFRAPHGQHTPFMAAVVHRHGMKMIGWDDSAGDWATRNASLVARRILRRIRPGSIVVLHDGLDGDVVSDRSVLVRALPAILDGLDARHLRVVRLDELLGRRGYVTC